MPQSRMTFPTPRKPAPVARCIECATGLGCRLHRARDAIRSKPSPEAVRGDRKVEGGTSAATGDESAPGSVNLSLRAPRARSARFMARWERACWADPDRAKIASARRETRDAEVADAGVRLAARAGSAHARAVGP